MLRIMVIRYDSVYLTCSKKLTGSQLSPPPGTNNKLKCETKNKPMSVIGSVQSHCHEGIMNELTNKATIFFLALGLLERKP